MDTAVSQSKKIRSKLMYFGTVLTASTDKVKFGTEVWTVGQLLSAT